MSLYRSDGDERIFNGLRRWIFTPATCCGNFVLLLYGVHCLQGWKMLEYGQTVPLYMAWLFVSVLMCLLYLFKIEERRLEDALVTITGIVYIGFFSYHAVLTEFSYSELCKASPVWLILITAFCTDIFAYFGGFFWAGINCVR